MKRMQSVMSGVALVSLLLAACQPAATPTPAAVDAPTSAPADPTVAAAPATEAPAAAEPITITYWAFGSEGAAMSGGELWDDWYNQVFDAYEAEHPGVTIDFALKGYDASGSTLVVDTAIAAGRVL